MFERGPTESMVSAWDGIMESTHCLLEQGRSSECLLWNPAPQGPKRCREPWQLVIAIEHRTENKSTILLIRVVAVREPRDVLLVPKVERQDCIERTLEYVSFLLTEGLDAFDE